MLTVYIYINLVNNYIETCLPLVATCRGEEFVKVNPYKCNCTVNCIIIFYLELNQKRMQKKYITIFLI